MASIEIWIQLENRPWDTSPHGKNRITSGKSFPQVATSAQGRPMYKPLAHSPDQKAIVEKFRLPNDQGAHALIYRRYKKQDPALGIAEWTVPEDRRVNPWDINEMDPTVTEGTIPGPIIECNVGDTVVVHFRNQDFRKVRKEHIHNIPKTTFQIDPTPAFDPGLSIIPFGINFKTVTETTQVSTLTEELLPVVKRTHSLHAHGFAYLNKHDGAYPLSPEDSSQHIDSAERNAWNDAGVTGNNKKGDRVPPGGTFIYRWNAGTAQGIPWPTTAGVWLYHDHSTNEKESIALGAVGMIVIHNPEDSLQEVDIRNPPSPKEVFLPSGIKGPLDANGKFFKLPTHAQYLLLFHSMPGAEMCINGRQHLGNTPTLIAGLETRMRFGVAGLGNDFHTFHIHGHRWIVPGPSGTEPGIQNTGIQNSPQNHPVSQFEDTRVFGPASSFVFTIDGSVVSFMRAGGDPSGDSRGEWFMHCHVASHMHPGMVGSLLIAAEGEPYNPPSGSVPEDHEEIGEPVDSHVIHVMPVNQFHPHHIKVPSDTDVTFIFQEAGHTIEFSNNSNVFANTNELNGGMTQFTVLVGEQRVVRLKGRIGERLHYKCGKHDGMEGWITII